MSKVEFIGFIIIVLLVLGFLAVLVTPQLIAQLDVRQSFYRSLNAGELKEAERLLEAYISEQPESAWVWLGYSRLRSRQGRNLDAYSAVMMAIDLDPKYQEARLWQIHLATRIGTVKEIRTAIEEYRKHGGNRPRIHTYLGWIHAHEENYTRAEEEYRAYLDVMPDDVYTLISLADVTFTQGEPEKARELCARAMRIEPSNSNARELWRKLTGASDKP